MADGVDVAASTTTNASVRADREVEPPRGSGPLARLSAAPVREQVVAKLRAAIISQLFVPGQRLKEKKICELTGASRTAVREALRQLESESLVEVVPRQGPIVSKISLSDVEEIYELRMSLEGLAARLFARKATAAKIAELRATVEAIARPNDGRREPAGDPLSLKRHFYEILLSGAGNDLARRTLGALLTRVSALRATSLGQPGRLNRTVEELRILVTAIENRDEEAAEGACRAHVRAAARVAIAVMGGDPDRAFREVVPAAGPANSVEVAP